ncbi:MAG: hypothetical protein IJJ85_07760 [Clostridia bacterium]|nr:hypothetical protein [Clostridia bacterium]
MPNYVSNLVEFSGDPISEQNMLIAIRDEKYGLGTIDFNKLIPMPEALQIEAGSSTDKGLKAYKDFAAIYSAANGITGLDLLHIPETAEQQVRMQFPELQIDEKDWELGRAAFHNFLQYGAPTWYEWCIQNWGTKWGACGYELGMDYGTNCKALWFETAWSPPVPVIEELARRFPELEFTHRWADEDIGHNCGMHEYAAGERTEEFYPDGQKDRIDFALDVWGYDPEDLGYRLNRDGTAYLYMDREEFELIEIAGQTALFANERYGSETTPEGLYCYHLRMSDEQDRLAALEPYVKVNFGGTVFTKEPIDLGEDGCLELSEESEPNFLGQTVTLEDFMADRFDLSEEQSMGGM